MEVQTICLTITRKYNLGDYESEEISVLMSARVDMGEDPASAYSEVLQRCIAARNEAESELGLRKAPAVTTQSYMAGKRIQKPTNDYDNF